MPIENELKLTCSECGEKIATVRHLEGSVTVVWCEACDEAQTLESWLGWKESALAVLETPEAA